MSIKFRHLSLRVDTASGLFGADLKFSPGLNILQAGNTSGKSTCLQAIIYALGLERMLSPKREVPLTYVMTRYLEDPETGEKRDVTGSFVELELENSKGSVITVKRGIVSSASPKLVSVTFGPAVSSPDESYRREDFYVLDPGAAKNAAGFHRMLVDFFGWDIPTVRRFDGRECPLYIETIFPLFYVEQKAGWSAFPAAFPGYLQIKDVARLAVEFILGLETHEIELIRQQIEVDLAKNRAAWAGKRGEILALCRSLNAKVEGLAHEPNGDIKGLDEIHLKLAVGTEWLGLNEYTDYIVDEIERLKEVGTPDVEDVSLEVEKELDRRLTELEELSNYKNMVYRTRLSEIERVRSLDTRIRTLEEDLQKNKDAKKLKTLGSTLLNAEAEGQCPTCSQPIVDTLMSQESVTQVMSIEENIEFIQAQRGIFQRARAQAVSAITKLDMEFASAVASVNETSKAIRALRAELTASSAAPSTVALEARFRAEAKLDALHDAEQTLSEYILALEVINKSYIAILNRIGDIPEDRFSRDDFLKFSRLQSIIRERAEEFGFSTFPPAELELSMDSYRPEKEGFEIGFELSASDTVRLKWAYQLSLMELAREKKTNHPGVLVFDEPRQQETAKVSFGALVRRSAVAGATGQQVILATSEEPRALENYLLDVECNLITFSGKIFRRIDGD